MSKRKLALEFHEMSVFGSCPKEALSDQIETYFTALDFSGLSGPSLRLFLFFFVYCNFAAQSYFELRQFSRALPFRQFVCLQKTKIRHTLTRLLVWLCV